MEPRRTTTAQSPASWKRTATHVLFSLSLAALPVLFLLEGVGERALEPVPVILALVGGLTACFPLRRIPAITYLTITPLVAIWGGGWVTAATALDYILGYVLMFSLVVLFAGLMSKICDDGPEACADQ